MNEWIRGTTQVYLFRLPPVIPCLSSGRALGFPPRTNLEPTVAGGYSLFDIGCWLANWAKDPSFLVRMGQVRRDGLDDR